MLQLGIVDVIQAEREREVEAAVRRRQLLKPREEGEPVQPVTRQSANSRSLAARVRSSAG